MILLELAYGEASRIQLSFEVWALIILSFCFLLLSIGKYNLLDKMMKVIIIMLAPNPNPWRLLALWLISMISTSDSYLTVWVPVAFFLRFDLIFIWFGSIDSSTVHLLYLLWSIIVSASFIAVPDGLSFFWVWWISSILIS